MKTEAIRGDWAGRVIDGRFTLHQWLGGSDASGVFLTELPGDQPQKAAIRLIPAGQKDADAQLARWQAAASLSHPHLLRLFYCGRCQIAGNPMLYALTEYAEENLAEILPHRPLTATETRETLDPVLDALSYLHGKGFVHGHLKPSNIMVVNDQVKLSSDSVQAVGKIGKLVAATGALDAPEYSIGAISPAADVWSLGVTLVEALTQHPPVWDRATQDSPVVPESMPQPFAAIARESLRTDPARRCSLGEIVGRLKAPPAQQQSSVPESTPATPAKIRLSWIVAPAVVAILLIAFFLMRSHRSEPSPDAAEQQSETAIAKPSPSSPAPEMRDSKPAAAPALANDAVVEQVLPDVSQKAAASIHGQFLVKVRVSVDATGAVSSADVDSQGPSKYFASLALEAARHWRFKPAQVNGEDVASAWTLQFRFTRSGTEVTPVRVSP